jgi:uncharacterized protein (DUF362 family)/Pyruvate/2-oxoacid:ferredoxin oxidoreductase delta subunit
MKARVSIVRVERGDIKRAVQRALELLGGVECFVKPGGSYLLKPNLFTTKTAEDGATTDLRILLSLAELVKEAGAEPFVGECPAMVAYAQPDIVFDGLGVRSLCEEAGVELRVLDREPPVRVEIPRGVVLKEAWFPESAVRCDGVINIPKLKTHILTKLTCAVKNLFGLQQGGSKARHHVATGNDPERFSQLLLDLYSALKQRIILTVVDAIVGMEGEGPGSGEPVEMNLVIAGDDAVAVDMVSTALIGWDPLEVGTNRLAAERGLGPGSLDEIEVLGLSLEEASHPFRRPMGYSSLEPFISAFRPIVCIEHRCVGCGACVDACPGGALDMVEGRPRFEEKRCIQCFCCVELCPQGALRVVRVDE